MKKRLLVSLLLASCAAIGLIGLTACDDSGSHIQQEPEKPPVYHTCEYTTLQEREEPTCTTYGYEIYACTCGTTNRINLEPLGHSFSEWEVAGAPTLYNAGWIENHCTHEGCEYFESDGLPQISTETEEYTYEITKEPTIMEAGEAVYSITVHGKEFSFNGAYLAPGYTLNFSITEHRSYSFYGYKAESLPEHLVFPETYDGKPITNVNIGGDKAVKSVTTGSAETRVFGRGNTTLEKVVYAEGLTEIDSNAFYGCTALREITIPNSLESIGERAFEGCTSLETLDLSNTKLTSIGAYPFGSCTALTSLTLPNTLKDIPHGLVHGCTNLQTITLPTQLEAIGNYAFQNCENLTSLTLPATLKSVGGYSFSGCSSLARVDYLGDLTDWCGISFYNAVSNPLYNGNVEFVPNGTFFQSNSYYVTGDLGSPVLFSFNFLVIPEGVTEIGNYQFYGLTDDEDYNVVIEGDVTSIGENAFSGCNIKNLFIGKNVTTIDEYAFQDSSLQDTQKAPYITIYYGGSHEEWASSALSSDPTLSAITDVKFYAEDAASATDNTWCYGEDGCVYEWVAGSNGYEKVLDKAMSYKYDE